MMIRQHPAASLELDEAMAWYAQRNPQAANGLWRKVMHARGLIAAYPLSNPLIGGFARRFVLHGYPYDLIYGVGGKHIDCRLRSPQTPPRLLEKQVARRQLTAPGSLIINSPYVRTTQHWEQARDGTLTIVPARRPAGYEIVDVRSNTRTRNCSTASMARYRYRSKPEKTARWR